MALSSVSGESRVLSFTLPEPIAHGVVEVADREGGHGTEGVELTSELVIQVAPVRGAKPSPSVQAEGEDTSD
jgi:hypothetical protein